MRCLRILLFYVGIISCDSFAESASPTETYTLMGGDGTKYSSLGELVSAENTKMQAGFGNCMANPGPSGSYYCVSRRITSNTPSPHFPTVNGKATYYSLNGEFVAYSKGSSQAPEETHTTYAEGWLGASLSFSCPADLYAENTGNSSSCKPWYVSAVPQSSPPAQCPVLNPVDPSNGAKVQNEIDIDSRGVGQIGFARFFSNSNRAGGGAWYHSYQKSLYVVNTEKIERMREQSSKATTKSAACTNGWSELRSKISDSWAAGATAEYVNDTCKIKKNNVVVQNLPVMHFGGKIIETYFKPGYVQLVRENGVIQHFGKGANEAYSELNAERGKLESVIDAAPIAWRYKAPNGEIEDYNADGKLLSITGKNGVKQELFYDATSGLLTRVKDSTNRELVFAYTGNQISSVTVDGNKTTSYSYNALGLIAQVTRPDTTTRIYHYEDTRFPTYLTGITDERNKRYATWTYDAQGRAISSEHSGGAEKGTLVFNADGSTTLTNALNKQTIYRFADIAGARRVVKVEGQPTANCAGANQDYTYTAEGWIASKTDWKGVKTTYQYNATGQEISRTEAFGTSDARTITTEWHPSLYLKTKVTEPTQETTFNYDANGRLMNQSVRTLTN